MNTPPNADSPSSDRPVKPLTKVLGQSEEVKDLVDEGRS